MLIVLAKHLPTSDSGEVRTMFAHEQTLHGPYLDRFFDANPESELAWIHHLGTRRYAPAADAVQKLSTDAEELDEKHVRHSLAVLHSRTYMDDAVDAEHWQVDGASTAG